MNKLGFKDASEISDNFYEVESANMVFTDRIPRHISFAILQMAKVGFAITSLK